MLHNVCCWNGTFQNGILAVPMHIDEDYSKMPSRILLRGITHADDGIDLTPSRGDEYMHLQRLGF
jgi:hypothetical protein